MITANTWSEYYDLFLNPDYPVDDREDLGGDFGDAIWEEC